MVLAEPAPRRRGVLDHAQLGRLLVGARAEAAVVDGEHRETEVAHLLDAKRAAAEVLARAVEKEQLRRLCIGVRRVDACRRIGRPAASDWCSIQTLSMSCVRASRASSSDDAGGTGIAWKIHLRCCVPIVAQPAERPPKRTTTAATSVSRRGLDTNALAASGSMTFVTTFFTVFGVVLHPGRVFSDNARTRLRVEWAHRNQMLHSKSRAMSTTTRRLVGLAAIVFAAHASAQVTFYEGEGFRGRTFQANSRIWNFERFGFNDRASSVVVEPRPLGSLRGRGLSRPLRRPAPRQLRLAARDGPEQPDLVGPSGRQQPAGVPRRRAGSRSGACL
jgi:hypothetical protein